MAQQQGNGFAVWLTGMHGTGKTTIASYIEARLKQVGRPVEVLDEQELAEPLWEGIEPEIKEDHERNVKRVGFVASLLARHDVAVLVASVSPHKATREEIRKLMPRFVEVYVDCPTETLIERDTTGLYKRALNGEIPNFIGITEPYEPPAAPEVTIQSAEEGVEEGALKIFQALLDLRCLTSEELKIITGKNMRARPLPKKQEKPASGRPTRTKAAEKASGEKSATKPAAAKARSAKGAAAKAAQGAKAARATVKASKAAPKSSKSSNTAKASARSKPASASKAKGAKARPAKPSAARVAKKPTRAKTTPVKGKRKGS